jgi:excisionase family DNA binding protein
MSAPLLNLAQVAARLGVSRTTAWRLVTSGALPSVAVTSSIKRVDESDLERWIDERRGQRSAPASVVPLKQERS